MLPGNFIIRTALGLSHDTDTAIGACTSNHVKPQCWKPTTLVRKAGLASKKSTLVSLLVLCALHVP
eukprot:10787362-Alexandrium_andersonii.AAC.1